MGKSTSIAKRILEVYIDGKWIANTNYKEQLQSLTWEQAIFKINNLNSIAELTYHINYYLNGILTAFEKDKLEIQDKYSFAMPSISSALEWNNLSDKLLANAEALSVKVAAFDDDKLQEVFFDEKYGSYERNIEALLEHSYYHLGQIVLLRNLGRK